MLIGCYDRCIVVENDDPDHEVNPNGDVRLDVLVNDDMHLDVFLKDDVRRALMRDDVRRVLLHVRLLWESGWHDRLT